MNHTGRKLNKDNLTAITGLGMVSSVGRDVVTSCASLRAGLTRPHEVFYPDQLDDLTAEPVLISGHPIRGFTDGFYLLGTWTRLAERCMEDLASYARLPDRSDHSFWRRTELVLVTPSVDAERYQIPQTMSSEDVKEMFGVRLLEGLQLSLTPEQLHVVSVGHAGTSIATEHAVARIAEGRVDRVVVLAVDSYLDWFTLDWLTTQNRLKTEDNATGLAPGEAGACFMLESAASCRKRGAVIEAVIAGAESSQAATRNDPDDVSTGREVANILGNILSHIPSGKPFSGDFISDLNGENWRATEMAGAFVRLGQRVSSEVRIILPATSIGDTGAASGAVAVCMAVRSVARGYAGSGHVMTTSISDDGRAGAVCLAAYA